MSDQVDEQPDVTHEWLEGYLATVFSRWHPPVAHLLQPTSDAIIAAAEIEPGNAVLDVGSGSGVPALGVAALVHPGGRVLATDPSPIFLAALAENVRTAGLGNVKVVEASAEGLPFEPATFDAATCHMGVMFFPDVRAPIFRPTHQRPARLRAPHRTPRGRTASPRPAPSPLRSPTRALPTSARSRRRSTSSGPRAWRRSPRSGWS